MFKVKIKKSNLIVSNKEPIAAGASKAYFVSFDFDEEWDGLVKNVIFKAGETSMGVLLEGQTCTIPWEVLLAENIGEKLWVGVYGSDAEGTKLPTVWNELEVIQAGAELCESGSEPTPTAVSLIYEAAKNAESMAENAESMAQEAVAEATASKEAAAQSVKKVNEAVYHLGAPGEIYTEGAVAHGIRAVAGGKAFKIYKAFQKENGEGVYQLSSIKGIKELMEKGEVRYSVVLGTANYMGGVIKIASEDNGACYVRVTGFIPIDFNNKNDDLINCDFYNTFHIYGHPELGSVNVGYNAFSSGIDTFATNTAAVALGRNNNAIGKYSAAFNRGNIAGHEAFAANSNNEALGDSSSVFGVSNKATRDGGGSFIAGGTNHEARAGHTAILGGWGLITANPCEAVAGVFNDCNNTYETRRLFSVGNGENAERRSNAFAVYGDGHAEVMTQGMTDNSVVTLGYLKSSQGLPPVTEADNGKMLMVRDGAWHMIEVVNAEEGEY